MIYYWYADNDGKTLEHMTLPNSPPRPAAGAAWVGIGPTDFL